MRNVLYVWCQAVVDTNGELNDVNKFLGNVINDWRKWQWIVI